MYVYTIFFIHRAGEKPQRIVGAILSAHVTTRLMAYSRPPCARIGSSADRAPLVPCAFMSTLKVLSLSRARARSLSLARSLSRARALSLSPTHTHTHTHLLPHRPRIPGGEVGLGIGLRGLRGVSGAAGAKDLARVRAVEAKFDRFQNVCGRLEETCRLVLAHAHRIGTMYNSVRPRVSYYQLPHTHTRAHTHIQTYQTYRETPRPRRAPTQSLCHFWKHPERLETCNVS